MRPTTKNFIKSLNVMVDIEPHLHSFYFLHTRKYLFCHLLYLFVLDVLANSRRVIGDKIVFL